MSLQYTKMKYDDDLINGRVVLRIRFVTQQIDAKRKLNQFIKGI